MLYGRIRNMIALQKLVVRKKFRFYKKYVETTHILYFCSIYIFTK